MTFDRSRQEKLALAIRTKKLREERKKQSDLGEKGRAGGLIPFIEYFWHILEPNTPLVIDMQMEAICLHLEAVTRGEIKRLCINVSPGAAKSLIVNVFWPAWEWSAAGEPHHRYMTFAYASHLTERDNGRFRDIVMSYEFGEIWGHVFRLTEDGKIKPVNDKRGWKFSSSIRGVGTGERGSRILCLPGTERVLTDAGWLAIQDIVDGKMDVRVAGFDHVTQSIVWQEIEAHERNPGNEIVEIACEGGSLKCTRDHPVYVQGRGYACADSLREGEKLVWCGRGLDLPALQGRDTPQAKPSQEVLQQAVSHCRGESILSATEQSTMSRVRDDGLPTSFPPQKDAGRTVLQSRMPRRMEQGGKQPVVYGRLGPVGLQALRKRVPVQAERIQEIGMLLDLMCGEIKMGASAVQSRARSVSCVPPLQDGIQAGIQRRQILHGGLQGRCAFAAHEGTREWPLRPREGSEQIPPGLEQEPQGGHPGPRRLLLSEMRHGREGSREGAPRPSHRLQQGQLGAYEPDNSMQVLSRADARQQAFAGEVETRTVLSVKAVGREDIVFNVRVTPCHNYFVNGILVHNCDDLHNVKEAESEAVRSETVRWAREGMSNRLNDMQEGVIVLIGQRVHDEDVSAVLLADKLGYVHLCIPMEFEPSQRCETAWWRDPRRDAGELASPRRFPAKVVNELKKTLGPYAWSSQYQQRPEPRGGGILKRDWWGLYEVAAGEGFKHVLEFRLASLDSAYTSRQENDPSGFSVYGVYFDERRNPKIVLLAAWEKWLELHGQDVERKPGETEGAYVKRAKEKWGLVEWVAHECKRFKVHNLLIENKASGHSVAQEMRRLYADEQWAVRLVDPGSQDKRARAYSVQHLFANGAIQAPGVMKDGKPVFRDFAQFMIDQAAKFRGLAGDEDNAVDTLTQALRFLRDMNWAKRSDEVLSEEREKMTRRHGKRESIYGA